MDRKITPKGCHGRNLMVVGITTTCVISAYHCTKVVIEFESRSRQGVLDTTLCDKVCPISSTDKTDYHDIAKIIIGSDGKLHNPNPYLSQKGGKEREKNEIPVKDGAC